MSESFSSLGVSNWLVSSLRQLGITNASLIQKQAIPAILSPQRQNVFACSRTGSGKTLAYLLPIIELLVRDPIPYFALILAPTRELANQINQMITSLTISTYAVKSLLIIGGEDTDKNEVNNESQGLWFGKPNIVVATPGRILDQFTNRNFLDVCGIKKTIRFNTLVLDEADQLISSSFCQQLKDILAFLDDISNENKRKRQTLLFSATLTTALEQLKTLITQKSRDEQPFMINLLPTIEDVKVELSTNPDLVQRYILCPQSVKIVYLIECILDLSFRQLIIFCATKKEAKLIHKVLLALGFDGQDFNMNPVILNSDMKQSLRFAALEKFRSLKSKILVTTDVANRGLDLPQVDLIINYNCPKSAIVYVHRVGRTCRRIDFKNESLDLIRKTEESADNSETNVEKRENRKKKLNKNDKLEPKEKTTNLLPIHMGKAITLITQYDINLFKSIENFIGIKMEKQEVDENNVITIMKQVFVAVKDAEIRVEHEDSQSLHIENKNRDKTDNRSKKLKTT